MLGLVTIISSFKKESCVRFAMIKTYSFFAIKKETVRSYAIYLLHG